MDYFLLLIAALFLAFQFATNKVFQTKVGSGILDSLEYNILVCLITALIFLAISGFRFEFTPYSFINVLIKSVVGIINTIVGLKVLKYGKVAIYTLFLMLGGMVVPYVYGIIFLNEKLTVLRIIAFLIMIPAIYLSMEKPKDNEEKKTAKIAVLLYAIVFITNGLISVLSKTHQIADSEKTVSTESYVVLGSLVQLCLNLVLIFFYRNKRADKTCITKNRIIMTVGLGALFAIVSGISYYFQLIGASHLPATVLYPMITGGSIFLTAVVAAIIFKEKPSRTQIIGLSVVLISTCMFL